MDTLKKKNAARKCRIALESALIHVDYLKAGMSDMEIGQNICGVPNDLLEASASITSAIESIEKYKAI